jgi:hypothetical protein
MSRSRLFALAAAALAGATLTACDPVAQVQSAMMSRDGGSDVKLSDDAEKNECTTCAKFRARPPSGINVPPQL